MPLASAVCPSFFAGVFSDEYRVALYTDASNIGATVRSYTPAGEVVGDGYVPGGQDVKLIMVLGDGGMVVGFESDPTWSSATFTAAGALVYHKASNRALVVLAFGEPRTCQNGDFTLKNPDGILTLVV